MDLNYLDFLNNKILLAILSAFGVAIASGSGYLIYKTVNVSNNVVPLAKVETRELSNENRELKATLKPRKKRTKLLVPKTNSLGEKSIEYYKLNTLGNLFGGYLLDSEQEETKWTERYNKNKDAIKKSNLFKVSTEGTLKFVCRLAYHKEKESWNTPYSNIKEGEAKQYWDDVWNYCSVDATEEKPEGWPFEDI